VGDALVSRADEVHGTPHVLAVLSNTGGGQRVTREVVEFLVEPHRGVAVLDEIVEQEVVDVSAEVPEEGEEVAVPGERLCQRARCALVVAADALKRQIEAIMILGFIPRLWLIE